jgi:hypothetical protein
MALKVLHCSGYDALPQHWSVLRAIHTLNTQKNCMSLPGKSSPVKRSLLHLTSAIMIMSVLDYT